jgi:hypothetical protein
VNPKARMLPAISATCASLCVRALRTEGTRRSIGLARAVLLNSFPRHVGTRPTPPTEFRDVFAGCPALAVAKSALNTRKKGDGAEVIESPSRH